MINQSFMIHVGSVKIIFVYKVVISLTVSRYAIKEEIVLSRRNKQEEEHAEFSHTYTASS
jgi:hypothetical protein